MLPLVFSVILIVILFYLTYNVLLAINGYLYNGEADRSSNYFPYISIIIPARNEEAVVGRCIESILSQNYPLDRLEIIVVDGASTDGTFDVCMGFSNRFPGVVRVVRESFPRGKPTALNLGFKFAKGDIIGVFDGDCVLNKDVLLNAARYFKDNSVHAVQGRVVSINESDNLLTKLVSLEEVGWYGLILRGRERLGLFIPLTGSCFFF